MQTTDQSTDTSTIPHHEDVVRRGIKRELPCKLSDLEFTRIAKQRAVKEADRDQQQDDMDRDKKKRKDQIDELNDEISKMGRELRTGEQERTVPCNEIFRRALDGTGWIHTIRQDTYEEVERRPANAHETQRYLPSVDPGITGGGLIEQAGRAQGAEERSAAPEDDAHDDVPLSDPDDQDDEKPADEKPAKSPRKAKKS